MSPRIDSASLCSLAEPVFVNLLRSPGIDFQLGGPIRQPYLSCRPARQHRLAESNQRNLFLGFWNVYTGSGLCTINRVVAPARQAGSRIQGTLKGLQMRALLSLELKKEDKQSAFFPQNNGAKISRKKDRERYRDIVLQLKKWLYMAMQRHIMSAACDNKTW